MAKDEKSKAGGPKAGKASQAAVVPATAVGEPKPRITEKEYQRELRRMHGEVVAMKEWIKATGAKVCIAFEGRDGKGRGHQGHQRAGQPAGVPTRGAARAERSRAHADVHTALPAALPGRRRGRHL